VLDIDLTPVDTILLGRMGVGQDGKHFMVIRGPEGSVLTFCGGKPADDT
jgi:hypothetical protein